MSARQPRSPLSRLGQAARATLNDSGESEAAEGQSHIPETVTTVRFPAREVARAVLVIAGLIVGLYLLWRLQEVLFLFFLAIIVATAIEPLVNMLRRGPFTKGTGVLVVYATISLAIGLPAYFAVPTLVNQATAFVEYLPDRLQTVRPYLQTLPRPIAEPAETTLDRASNAVSNPEPPAEGQLVEAGASAVHKIVSFVSVFVLAFYWIVERAAIKRAVLRVLAPKPSRAREANLIWVEVEEKLGGWLRGQLLLMLAIGFMAGIGYWVLGLPNPLLLAVLSAFGEMIPLVGPVIAFVPAVLVALMIDPALAFAVIVYAVIIQQIESHVLLPRIMGHTVGISPLVVLLGILAGAALYGIPGAFLAVPLAGAAQVILAHVLHLEDRVQAQVHDEIHGHAPDPTDDAASVVIPPDSAPADAPAPLVAGAGPGPTLPLDALAPDAPPETRSH